MEENFLKIQKFGSFVLKEKQTLPSENFFLPYRSKPLGRSTRQNIAKVTDWVFSKKNPNLLFFMGKINGTK